MKYLLIALPCLVGLLTSCADATDEQKTKYEVVFREKLAGSYEKWTTEENNLRFHYAYTDRGRGPELEEEIALNDQQFVMTLKKSRLPPIALIGYLP